jgi:hypothetical protein
MKKNALSPVIISLVLLFSACQKGLDDTQSGSYFVSFKANGVQKNFSGYTLGTFTTLGPLYACSIIGENALGDSTNGINLQIVDSAQITTKLYTDTTISGTVQAALVYIDSTAKHFASIFTIGPAGVKINITENTTDHVSGTFSGNLQNIDDIGAGNTGNIIAITEGSFTVKK